MIEQEENNLIQSTLDGNSKAQEILYDKYSESVRNFLKSKYSSCYDLDDDVAEIMIKVFINLNKFDVVKSKFRTWIFSIAKNHMIDKWRNSANNLTLGRNDNVSLDSQFNVGNDGYISACTSNNVMFYSNCFENNDSVNYISTQLSAIDFRLLNMKYVQGYNYNEIGKEFNMTSSTISNRINYIKTKLKKNYSEFIFD